MQDKIRAEIKASLLAGDRLRSETLKMALTALQYAQIANGGVLSDEDAVSVLQKEIKKRKEAAEMYRGANAVDRAGKEESEIEVLSGFVPKLLSGTELETAVDKILSTLEQPTFPVAMKACLETLENVDKTGLAAILKTKLS